MHESRYAPSQEMHEMSQDMHAKGTIMLCLYYYVFLMSSYMFKMFLLLMFGKLSIVLLQSNLGFETAVKQFETS